MSIKIGDFGFSKEESSNPKSFAGTTYYQSPEILNNKPYSFKTDVWFVFKKIVDRCVEMVLGNFSLGFIQQII